MTTRLAGISEKLQTLLPESLLRDSYFVGGCVRDELLGRDTADIDIVVERDGGAHEFVHLLALQDPVKQSKPFQVGRGYPIWQINIFDLSLQVADTQSEMFMDEQSRQRSAKFGTLKQDGMRRDFSVNMLYRRISNGALYDASGLGLSDLFEKRLRLRPDVDGARILSDDPLRILRAFRFAAQLGFVIDRDLTDHINKSKKRLCILSKERILQEFEKGLATQRRHEFLNALWAHGLATDLGVSRYPEGKLNLFSWVLPEQALYGMLQSSHPDWPLSKHRRRLFRAADFWTDAMAQTSFNLQVVERLARKSRGTDLAKALMLLWPRMSYGQLTEIFELCVFLLQDQSRKRLM